MFNGIVIGNLGADAEVKEANGKKFVVFRVADTVKMTNQNGQETESTTWVDCSMQNTESKLIPYLKRGVKVMVQGRQTLRIYSSPKDRCMKAGVQLFVNQIELCGIPSDPVPRQLIDPNSGMMLSVKKLFWVDTKGFNLKKGQMKELYDTHSASYLCDHLGFVTPVVEIQGKQTGNQNEIVQSQS